jgi:hypothetical protein
LYLGLDNIDFKEHDCSTYDVFFNKGNGQKYTCQGAFAFDVGKWRFSIRYEMNIIDKNVSGRYVSNVNKILN